MHHKSWGITALVGAGGAALSAYVNLFASSAATAGPALLMAKIHIGAALIGSLLFARFIQGSPDALKGPTHPSTVGTSIVTYRGAVRVLVPGKSAFFSAIRCLLLLGFMLCLMIQFVQIAPPDTVQPFAPSAPVRSLAT
ncbi:hypothetical protein LFL96_22360 [Paraburkholderia sp. D15]|uniref:hypothetical protein n=1 Tax=Paraburkholderia sp. D15 TaxID=2880218 RepID=UPI00247A81A8|nr:hypothetical protein [Paraburkholderia sp. D15]WGS53792.1 hypothetical protein LFL96_22360 [Paraburkholderia sp. D15]WKF60680.1 hypothetical protein HUO10_005201 [Paraburkholderia busanensis]